MSLSQEPALSPDEGQGHLQRLTASWNILADLCFADLLLLIPAPGPRPRDGADRFVVYGQMRPTTIQTLHNEDLVGRVMVEDEMPLVARAWRLGQIVEGEITIGPGEQRRVQCIPVRWKDELVAVLTREAPLAVGGRRLGQLEKVYVEIFDRLARMISAGEFPFAIEDAPTAESPRVGDGVVVLDATGRVEYASPNAVNALHRMGIYTSIYGARLDEIGVEETAIQKSFHEGVPFTEEVERHPAVIVLLRCIPLLEAGEVTGALVLSRDVTDLRRRDRLLLSKDATIREVHHRVKNNLQTISSLLRLQSRRLPPGEGRVALGEAERRIRSIALVHEILSRDPAEQAAFNEIVEPLVRMAKEGVLTPDRPVRFSVEGDAGEVPAELATPLAVVITELLQNAVEHAFPEDVYTEGERRVRIVLRNDGIVVTVQVHDNGRGLPPGFSIETSEGLGLSIVRDLIMGQLGGTLEMRAGSELHSGWGTRVELRVPLLR
ncbi:MAG: PAS domain-containing sensor histidine kinase [Actinomycetota bacterium]|nr:PAS domain-containing sensor histidine kinase [Actinomycetota bacterium]